MKRNKKKKSLRFTPCPCAFYFLWLFSQQAPSTPSCASFSLSSLLPCACQPLIHPLAAHKADTIHQNKLLVLLNGHQLMADKHLSTVLTFSTRSSKWSSLSTRVPFTPVSIMTLLIGRQCFSKLSGERSTNETLPSPARVPLDGVHGDELFGGLLQPPSSASSLIWWSYAHTRFKNIYGPKRKKFSW